MRAGFSKRPFGHCTTHKPMTSIATRFNTKTATPFVYTLVFDGTEAIAEFVFEGVQARILADFPGYAFTIDGRVISFKGKSPCVLRPGTSAAGRYCYVNIGSRHLKRSQYVHIQVTRAFHPNPLGKPQVNHKDGNPRNNDASNLEWATNEENVQHANQLREIEGRERLMTTPEQRVEMSTLFMNGFSKAAIARLFDLPYDTVRAAINNAKKRATSNK